MVERVRSREHELGLGRHPACARHRSL